MIVLRLPIGARPQLGATSSVGSPVSIPAVTSSPFEDAIRVQTREDLGAVMTAAGRLYPLWKSYAVATPTVLNHTLPQFGFVIRTVESQQVEYAGPGQCVFARVVDRHTAAISGPTHFACRASATPKTGWTALTP